MNKLETLKQMWKEVFGDTETYLQMFFETIYQEENTLTIIEDNKLVAMLYMIPYTICRQGQMQTAVYLYALATKKEQRKHGYMTKLIEEANRIAKERGAVCTFLQPANESLYSYYEKRGFADSISKSYLEITWEAVERLYCQNLNDDNTKNMQFFSIYPLSVEEYVLQEQHMLSKENAVWNTKHNLWYYQIIQMDGAECIELHFEYGKSSMMLQYITEEQKLIIWSTVGVKQRVVLIILYILREQYPYTTLIWYDFHNLCKEKDWENIWKPFLKRNQCLMINDLAKGQKKDWDKLQFRHILQ